MDWLLTPIDPARAHELTDLQSWHARIMFLAWGVIAPLVVVITRFLKITPKQNWPQQLDNQFWWRCHWIGQSAVMLLSMTAVFLLLKYSGLSLGLHSTMGFLVITVAVLQVLLGLSRGSKGGPTDKSLADSSGGDHYSMSKKRLWFESLHKSIGYLLLLMAWCSIVVGLWDVNAPRWMWIIIIGWWLCLGVLFIVLQRRGYAIDTYQAIWGPDPSHPGNRAPEPGWGMRRHEAGNHTRRSGDLS